MSADDSHLFDVSPGDEVQVINGATMWQQLTCSDSEELLLSGDTHRADGKRHTLVIAVEPRFAYVLNAGHTGWVSRRWLQQEWTEEGWKP